MFWKRRGYMKKLLLTIVMLGLCSIVYAKPAKCHIEDDGGMLIFKGKCDFRADKGGSFSLSNLNGKKPLFDEVVIVNVHIIAKGVAEVRTVNRHISSRWGKFYRSQQDRACWVNSHGLGKICAYAY